jgi:hypothetical protein
MVESMRAVTRAGALPAALLLAALAAPTAQAQDRGNPGWYVRVAPYLWASNIDGAVSLGLPADPQTVGGYHVAVEDTLLTGAWAVRAEVGKGRVRGWFNVSRAGLGPKPTEIEPIDGPADTLGGSFELTWLTGEAFAAVQVGPFTTTHAFEVYAGGRYVRHDQSVNVEGEDAPIDISESWIEPAFGARLWMELGRRFWTAFNTDIGGFSIGSEFTWTLGGELGFRVVGPLDISMRYNYQEVDYDNGLSGADAYAWSNGAQQGWLFGAVLKL